MVNTITSLGTISLAPSASMPTAINWTWSDAQAGNVSFWVKAVKPSRLSISTVHRIKYDLEFTFRCSVTFKYPFHSRNITHCSKSAFSFLKEGTKLIEHFKKSVSDEKQFYNRWFLALHAHNARNAAKVGWFESLISIMDSLTAFTVKMKWLSLVVCCEDLRCSAEFMNLKKVLQVQDDVFYSFYPVLTQPIAPVTANAKRLLVSFLVWVNLRTIQLKILNINNKNNNICSSVQP